MRWIRRQLAVVLQDSLLLSGSIRDNLRFARAVGVGGELDGRACLVLLEPGRKALDEPRSGHFGLRARDAERDANEAAQRSALFRRLKNPSSSTREA